MLRRLAMVSALGLAACGPMGPATSAASRPEPMPHGGDWQGVYQGPYHIYLRIQRAGSHAIGTWRAMGGREGELWGDVSGNVLHFNWAEQDLANRGEWTGRGYFVYRDKGAQKPPEIRGEWGLGLSDSDGSWWAVKRVDLAFDASETRLADSDSGPADEGGASAAPCLGACGADDDVVDDDQAAQDDDRVRE